MKLLIKQVCLYLCVVSKNKKSVFLNVLNSEDLKIELWNRKLTYKAILGFFWYSFGLLYISLGLWKQMHIVFSIVFMKLDALACIT